MFKSSKPCVLGICSVFRPHKNRTDVAGDTQAIYNMKNRI